VTASDPLVERIPDARLRELAEKGSDEPVSVIIELDVPELQVEAERIEDGPDFSPRRVVPTPPGNGEVVEEAASDARQFLERLVGKPPVYLRSARAFVATVNGRQLREIAARPFTKRIEPNRQLKR
jgi:hypothetical protein